MEQDTQIYYLKKRHVLLWVLLPVLLVAAIAALNIRITSVSVKGNKTYTDEEAAQLVFSGYWDSNTVYCMVNGLLDRKKTIPFVADYEIVLNSPVSCDLIIYEKNPVGCIKYMDGYMYFDKDGMVIESSQECMEDVPVVKGISFGHIVLGKELPVSDTGIFSDVMNVTQQFAQFGIGCESIEFDQFLNITAVLTGGDITVELGSNEDISAKISALNDMLPIIREKGLSGTLDLSTYKDTDESSATSFKVQQ